MRDEKIPLKVLRGVEIDTNYKGKDVHVLGYHFSETEPALRQAMAWNRSQRVDRAQRITEKIHSLGYDITFQEVLAEAAGSRSLGRPHIARLLVKKGFFPDVKAVFDTLIGKGKPCYLRQVKLPPREAAALIHQAGGLAVQAHPEEIGDREMALRLLEELPYDGLEVYHPSAKEKDIEAFWLQIAQERGLLIAGGSDYHGNAGRFPEKLTEWRVHRENVRDFIKRFGF